MTVPTEQLPSLIERLTRMETKLDYALQTHADHEGRIRRLERAVWLAAGVGVAGGSALSQWLGSAF